MVVKMTILKRILVCLSLFVGLVIFLVGCDRAAEKPETVAATMLLPAKEIVDFQLAGFSQGNFDNDSTRGRWSFFFFGYTRCPDVCPTELYMLSQVIRRIEKDPMLVDQIPQVVFVSVDPQQDKSRALEEYAQFYHPLFLGVTGEQSTIDRLTRSMGAFYQRAYYAEGKLLAFDAEDDIPEGFENSYLINHSATIFLLNPDGKLHAVFSAPHQPDVMVRDLAAIQAAWR